MRWWLIALRASGWPLLAVVAGLVLSGLIDHLTSSSPYFAQLEGAGRWIAFAGVLVALALWLLAWRSLRLWEQDKRSCDHCGGPLGWRVHEGRVYYGKQLPDFRRCYNCGKATPDL